VVWGIEKEGGGGVPEHGDGRMGAPGRQIDSGGGESTAGTLSSFGED